MVAKSAAVRFTANFEANLEQISAFWAEHEAPQAYSHLLDELAGTVIGNLEQHPRIGRKFFARTAQSLEVCERVKTLLKRFGDAEVREYLSGDYLLLYCVVATSVPRKPGLTVYLLAIKHHRQLSFDFEGFWRANRGEDR
ncbi:type II toxin-antitoxin system RelE/ParE family toxin [Rhodoferax sp.]|uniref:type II toxin-antitoxin system RelE/ParE family toxin n=1 Tax=Rhodoferax sp. TaxID=50421 RepID=UPI00274CF31F|nr:type II toxin-antitoxin system RelE/ParE family toxin [Rhodoferax sp.]